MPYKDPAKQKAWRNAYVAGRRAGDPAYAARERERRRSYRLPCPDCGGQMSGGNGKANDPQRCLSCERARIAVPHGASKYRRGCRCDDCRAGNTIALREYRARRRATLSPDQEKARSGC